MSPLDAQPHVLLVHADRGDEEPSYRWEPAGILTATSFPDRLAAEAEAKHLRAYLPSIEVEVVALQPAPSI